MAEISVLEVAKLAFRYGKTPALSDVTLSLGFGVSVLLGRNGAGKTTMLRIMAGAVRSSHGEVRFNGQAVGGTRSGRRALRNIGWLPQVFGFPPQMTVAKFVAYSAWLKEVPRQHIPARVAEVVALVDLAAQVDQPLRALSGGQLRRAGFAAAMAADPVVLILDEPTAGLDPEQRDGFHTLIRQVRTEKVVVVATHLLEDVEALADQIIVIDHGTVRWTGTPRQLAGTAGASLGMSGLRQGFQRVVGNR